MTELNSRRAVREFERSRANRRRMRPSDVRRVERDVRKAGRGPAKRKSAGSRFFSVAAMLFAGALLVGTTIPANAFISASNIKPGTPVTEVLEPQSLAVDAGATGITATRDAFSAMSWAEVLTAKYGNRSYEYSATMGTIRWPFPFASPISDGFGERVAPATAVPRTTTVWTSRPAADRRSMRSRMAWSSTPRCRTWASGTT